MSSLFGSAPAAPAETCMSLQASSLTRPQSQSFKVRGAHCGIPSIVSLYRSATAVLSTVSIRPRCTRSTGPPTLFVPAPFPGTAGLSPSAVPGTSIFGPGHSVGGAAAGTSARVITDLARLPLPQTFVVPVAAAPEYAHWSHEELRFHAHLRGIRAPPSGAPVFALAPVSAAPAPAFPGASALPVPDARDTFVTIATRPEFAGHSVEFFSPSFPLCPRSASLILKSQPSQEFRFAWLRHGAELTSAQIFANSGGALSSQPAAPSNPIFALSTAPSIFGVPARKPPRYSAPPPNRNPFLAPSKRGGSPP
ncbi:hypothetical protein K438DRAFT_1978476 [Mycena galopus ATCC 62051]|nr:hypothetical protein K438DRAFT_1978476 [Mycena galopus ATCC 62051]